MSFLKLKQSFTALLWLRLIAIGVQLGLIALAHWALKYPIEFNLMLLVIAGEVIFTALSWLWHHKQSLNHALGLFVQLLADVLFLSALLYLSGGATNAFISLLLIPLALASVLLARQFVVMLTIIAISLYSLMLWLMPMHVIHGNMQGHFVGMWLNFLLSAVVVAIVVTQLASTLSARERAINHYREQQLKQEQMVALAIASAQVTHEIATPLATMQLLQEELAENYPDDEIIRQLNLQIKRCQHSVQSFRASASKATAQQAELVSLADFYQQVTEQIRLNHPDLDLTQNILAKQDYPYCVQSNVILLPAVLNLINNAVRASKQAGQQHIELTWQVKAKQLQLTIRDFGAGFSAKLLEKLGSAMVQSEQGLGMAVFLTHASLESLGGNLTLANHAQGGALVSLTLPLMKS